MGSIDLPTSVVLEEGSFFKRYKEGVHLFWKDLGEFFINKDTFVLQSVKALACEEVVFECVQNSLPTSVVHWFSGETTLHGTAVRYEGKNIAFIGDSVFGKSTIAHYFLMKGAKLLAEDDLRYHKQMGTFEQFQQPYQKLWKHTYDELGSPFKLIAPLSSEIEKYVVEVPVENGDGFRLDAIFSLGVGNEVLIKELSFTEALLHMVKFSKCEKVVGDGFHKENFIRVQPIAKSVPCFHLERPKGLEYMNDAFTHIVEKLNPNA